MTPENNPAEATPYNYLHAIVVDALRYDISSSEVVDHAAHEVLQRLRDAGLHIPANPSV